MLCCCCFRIAFLYSFERYEVRKYSEVERSVNLTLLDIIKVYYRKKPQSWPKSIPAKPAFLNISLLQSLVTLNLVLKYWFLHLIKVSANFDIDFIKNTIWKKTIFRSCYFCIPLPLSLKLWIALVSILKGLRVDENKCGGDCPSKVAVHHYRPSCKTMWWRKFYTFLPLRRDLFLNCLLNSGMFCFIHLLLQGKSLTLSPDSFPAGQFFYNLPLLRCFVA